MTNDEIRSDLFIRAAVDVASGSNYVAEKINLPPGTVLIVRKAIEAGLMKMEDGVTVKELARGFLLHRLAQLG